MTQDEIIEMAKEAGLHVAHDSEGHFSGVTNEEIIDMYPDPNKERDRLLREKIFMEVLAPFAKLVAAKEREECAKIVEPKTPRSCDCESCDCGNSTSARMVAEWDESASIVKAIRAKGEA